MWAKFTGWLGRVFHRPTMLRAREEPFSVIGFLLIVVQSAALVLVFGHTAIFQLFSRDLTTVVVAGIALFTLVVSTYAMDVTARKAISRVGPLRRMQEDALAAWLIAYVAFVLLVEGGTFAVALYVVEQRPDALFSPAPILPNSGVFLMAQIGLRAAMLSLTFVMLQVVAGKLPLGYEAAITPARARVGGMIEETLATVQLEAHSLGDMMTAWGRLNMPMPRKRTRWNARAIARDEEYAARLRQQNASIVEAFTDLTRNKLAEVEAAHAQELATARDEAQRTVAAAQVEARRHIETAQRQVSEANDRATQRTLDAVLSLMATGALPEWLIELRPDLATFTLDMAAGKRGGRGVGGSGAAAADTSPAGRQRAFLAAQGIEPGKAPEGKRGVWLRASDLTALTGEWHATETPQALIKRLGGGAKAGLALAAPFADVLRELAERHLLTEDARTWWASQSGGASAGAGVSEDSGEMPAVTPPNVSRLRA